MTAIRQELSTVTGRAVGLPYAAALVNWLGVRCAERSGLQLDRSVEALRTGFPEFPFGGLTDLCSRTESVRKQCG